MKLKMKLVNKELQDKVKANEGYCICELEKNEDTKCPCTEFRNCNSPGLCHCGVYEKVESTQ